MQHIGILQVIVSRLSMQEEESFDCTYGKCHVYIIACKRRIFLSILMASVICVHFSQLVDHYVHMHPPHNIIEITHSKILVSALQHQVSRGDTYSEVADHQCTQDTPQNRVSDTIMHVILNTINNVVRLLDWYHFFFFFSLIPFEYL